MAANTCRIMIATDNHLGYGDKDEIRGQDSMETFEEILQIADFEEVDMILLGGDLFHHNKPSRKILCKTMKLLRKYIQKAKKQSLSLISNDPLKVFPSEKSGAERLYNPNVPIYSIHGNHDDPIGIEGLCSLDLLSSAGLVNYFGKSESKEALVIRPLVFQKENTYVAIYGIGALKDETLHQMLTNNQVEFIQPLNLTNVFSILVLHQNRFKRPDVSFIPESVIPDFFNLVIWGHEHESIMDPVKVPGKTWMAIQPGSTVATSLSLSESLPKHVAILNISAKSMKIQKIQLETIRPMIYEVLNLDLENKNSTSSNDLTSWVCEKIDDIVFTHALKTKPKKLPLVRLKVNHSSYLPPFNEKIVFKRFVGRVANPKNMVLFKKVNPEKIKNSKEIDLDDKLKIEELMKEFFLKKAENMENIFTFEKMSTAIINFVKKDDKESISGFIDAYLSQFVDYLSRNATSPHDDIRKYIGLFKKISENQVFKPIPHEVIAKFPPTKRRNAKPVEPKIKTKKNIK